MNLQEAQEIVGNEATWILKNMRRALATMNLLNTPEENRRLEAATIVLAHRRRTQQ